MENREAAIEWFSMLKEKFAKTEYEGYLDMAIAALEQQGEDNEWCLDCKEYDKEQHCCHRFTKVIRQAVEDHRREWPDGKWTPVSEALPEENLPVLVAVKQKDRLPKWVKEQTYSYVTDIDVYDDGDFDTHKNKVVAWRPLPEPYTEEDNDKP